MIINNGENMREKVKNLIYLDSERYMTINTIKIMPWATVILPFSVIVGSGALRWMGMLVVMSVCFFSSLILTRILQSNRIKKTFRLRFLVNGIVSFYMFAELSLLMLLISMAVKTRIMRWLLSAVIIFVVFYICIVVYMVHTNGFKRVKKAKMNRKFQAISTIAGALLPASGSIGYFASKAFTDTIPSVTKIDLACVLMSFVLVAISLGFINFVKYFYCVKYEINCDEKGKNHSPYLEYAPVRKKEREKKNSP